MLWSTNRADGIKQIPLRPNDRRGILYMENIFYLKKIDEISL